MDLKNDSYIVDYKSPDGLWSAKYRKMDSNPLGVNGEFNSWNYLGERLYSFFSIENLREGEFIDYKFN